MVGEHELRCAEAWLMIDGQPIAPTPESCAIVHCNGDGGRVVGDDIVKICKEEEEKVGGSSHVRKDVRPACELSKQPSKVQYLASEGAALKNWKGKERVTIRAKDTTYILCIYCVYI